MTRRDQKTLPGRIHIPPMAYEEKVFSIIFLAVLLMGLAFAEYAQYVRIRRAAFIPKPEPRKVAEVILREGPEPKPIPVVEAPKPKPVPLELTKDMKKRMKAPPPSSAVGSPKRVAEKTKEDIKQMVARKGLLGLLSKKDGDGSPRAYHPSKKRDVSNELQNALKNLGNSRTQESDDNDFLGVGNLPDVAKKGTDIGYILDAAKIGEVDKTQVEFYGGIEDLPDEIHTEADAQIEQGQLGRTASDIRKVVASYLGGLRYLYNKALRDDPSLKGKMVVRFEISPSGHVTQTSLVNSSIGYPPLESTILANIRKWKFPTVPEPNGSVTVTYPFVFLPPTS